MTTTEPLGNIKGDPGPKGDPGDIIISSFQLDDAGNLTIVSQNSDSNKSE